MCKGSGAPGNKTRSNGNSGSKLTRSFYLDFSREQTAASHHDRGACAGTLEQEFRLLITWRRPPQKTKTGLSGDPGRGDAEENRESQAVGCDGPYLGPRPDIRPYFSPRLRVSAFTEVRFVPWERMAATPRNNSLLTNIRPPNTKLS